MTRRLALRLLLVAALVPVGAGLLALGLERRFRALSADPLDLPPGTHVWAHRGTHGGYHGEGRPLTWEGGNTLPAFEASIARGFTGVELDIHFMGDAGFLISHEPPPPDALSLERVFATCGRRVYYWLDFKNLSPENVRPVTLAFRRLFARYPVRDRVVIESPQGRALAKLRDGLGGARVLWTVLGYPAPAPGVERAASVRSALVRTLVRWKIALLGFRNVSVPFYVCNEAFLRDFARIGSYVYTVNEESLMRRLRDAGVRVILTDRDELPAGVMP